ncbi:MAG: hypothetical protein WBA07_19890 [Rivularia sp. (in: cyanobacteria)]
MPQDTLQIYHTQLAITNPQCPIPHAHSLQKYAKCAKIVPNNGDYSSIIWNNLAYFLI